MLVRIVPSLFDDLANVKDKYLQSRRLKQRSLGHSYVHD